MDTLACVVGARPNLVKAAPLLHELGGRGVRCSLIHTGQHYDHELSRAFFDELDLPEPDAFLGVGSGTHAVQTAAALVGLEEWLLSHPVDGLIALGDVNSTAAAALAAVKIHVPVIHVEAGYRSGDMRMPEEVNRVVTDHVSSLLFPPTEDARDNLLREGIQEDAIHPAGNLMAETFLRHRDVARAREPWTRHGLPEGGFILVTMHRPENVDERARLLSILERVQRLPLPVIWPVHPRARGPLADVGPGSSVMLTPPLPYLDLIGLLSAAACVVTDSGGVQEEACLARVPCVTVRRSTERVATVRLGANRLATPERLGKTVSEALESSRAWAVPELWDRDVSARMADVLASVAVAVA